MRYVTRIVGFILFLLALGFAYKNTDPVSLKYYLGYEWHAPLVMVLFAFFLAGAAVGILASLSFIFRQRRELMRLKREQGTDARATDTHPLLPPTFGP